MHNTHLHDRIFHRWKNNATCSINIFNANVLLHQNLDTINYNAINIDILTTYRNEKLNVTGKIVPRYKMIKCHHRLTISLSSYAAYNQKK